MTNKRVGITGGNGFIGRHVCKNLRDRGIPYEVFGGDFGSAGELEAFVRHCHTVIHLAGRNRDSNEVLAGENARFAECLSKAMVKHGDKYVVFASSQYVVRHPEAPYSIGKIAAERALLEVGNERGCNALVVRLPNVYGPGGVPFYNSVVATLCWWKVNRPNTAYPLSGDIDALIEFIDVYRVADDLVNYALRPPSTGIETVSGRRLTVRQLVDAIEGASEVDGNAVLREMLAFYAAMPGLENKPVPQYPVHASDTGSFQELAHAEDVTFGQLSHGKIGSGATRGGHYHNVKEEWFCVLVGRMAVDFYTKDGSYLRTDLLEASLPRFLHIPAGYLHYVRNVGPEPIHYLLIANEVFDPTRPDTYPGPLRR
jgi:UDP-2-acetamido-2,6-beta-L-arabino-hexul-4-ose reductase